MRSLEGKPYVPPTCPQHGWGEIPNLAEEPLTLDLNGAPEGQWEITSFFGALDDSGDPLVDDRPNVVNLSLDLLPPDSALVRWLLDIAAADPAAFKSYTPDAQVAMESTQNPIIEKFRQRLCDRVSVCRGVIESGECWALGKSGSLQALQETYEEETTTG